MDLTIEWLIMANNSFQVENLQKWENTKNEETLNVEVEAIEWTEYIDKRENM